MEPRVDLDQIFGGSSGLTCPRELVEGVQNEATEGRATMTAGACVRASAQWPHHERYAGSRPRGSHQLGKTPIRPLPAFAFKATMITIFLARVSRC